MCKARREIDERTENQLKQIGIVRNYRDIHCKADFWHHDGVDAKAAQQDESLRGIDTAFSNQVEHLQGV